MLSRHQDAYGQNLYDYLKGKNQGLEIVERDDGFIQANPGARTYLSHYKDWSPREKEAMRLATGRVLDIGCGGGRHSLYLQQRGFRVLGVDISPLAIRVCRLRGLKNAHVKSITQLEPGIGKFDTVLMMGNGFGLFGNPSRARTFLRRFLSITDEKGRIIAESLDPYKTKDPSHLRYHQLNSRRGRMPGQVRIRIRYRELCSPWFDYLLVSKREMKQIVEGTGWKVTRFIVPRGRSISSRGQVYIAVLQRM
jgi:SAM-dependent methyltransferase